MAAAVGISLLYLSPMFLAAALCDGRTWTCCNDGMPTKVLENPKKKAINRSTSLWSHADRLGVALDELRDGPPGSAAMPFDLL